MASLLISDLPEPLKPSNTSTTLFFQVDVPWGKGGWGGVGGHAATFGCIDMEPLQCGTLLLSKV